MKRPIEHRRQDWGFTLAEITIACSIAAIILFAMTVGSTSLQKTFGGSDGALKATADQMRILDYVARDVRQALTITVTNSGQTLNLTTPDYIDPSTGLPRLPTIKPGGSTYGLPQGVVDYGSSASPISVSYFPAAAPTPPSTTYVFQANGPYWIRQVTNTQGTTQTVISRDCTSLQISFTDQTSAVTSSISYAPRYNFMQQANSRTGSMLYVNTTLRNTRRN